MKQIWTFLMGIGLLLPVYGQQMPLLPRTGEGLMQRLREAPDGWHDISILLEAQADLKTLDTDLRRRQATPSERAYAVITALQTTAAATQGPLLELLRTHPEVEAGSVRPFWVANVVFARVKSPVIRTLSLHPAVAWIDRDYPVALDRAYAGTAAPMSPGGREPGLTAIRAHELWAMGYTGYGRSALSVDTGVDPEHPALTNNFKGRYFPLSWSWLDPVNGGSQANDCDEHGSHTTGTMVGLDPLTRDTIGVAFGALWMGAQSICGGEQQSTMTATFQWALNPDGDPSTVIDMPDVVNNSWFHPGLSGECNSFYVPLLDAMETAGISVVFSAGNAGPGVSSMTAPKNISINLVNTFTVGNLNANAGNFFPINSSSSRGPSICGGTGSLLIKPEVSAPGTGVRSSVPGGQYSSFTGTSMAAPHVSGAILLLKEAFPSLPAYDLKLALYQSATDLGLPGEDNAYGMGLINLKRAFDTLVAQGHVPAIPSNANDLAAMELVNLPEVTCGLSTPLFPFLFIRNQGTDTVHSARILISYDGTVTDTLDWAGQLGPAGNQLLLLPTQPLGAGGHELRAEIVLVNGQSDYRFLDNRISKSFTLASDLPLTPVADPVCQGGDVAIEALPAPGWQTAWFADSLGTVPLAVGSQVLLGPVQASQILYAGSIRQSRVGPQPDSLPQGEYHTGLPGGLRFDCLSPVRILSVKARAATAGPRLVQIRDAQGAIVKVQVVQFTAGEQVLNLDWQIPAGQDYLLTFAGNNGLWRNRSGAAYPYTLGGSLSITGARDGSSAYEYFYDWVLQEEGLCPRTALPLTVLPDSLIAAFVSVSEAETGDTVQFFNQSLNGQSFSWEFGDGSTGTGPNPVHVYDMPGEFIVRLTAAAPGGCTDVYQDTLTVTGWPTAVAPDAAEGIRLYPNPASGAVRVAWDEAPKGAVTPVLLDASGRVARRYAPAAGLPELLLDLRGLERGWYLLELRQAQGRQVLPLIVE
ncbi:MAG: S8 family serine peptidase [Bacteroidia bacterium]|nr:S8 family serine peptidase [Bacteroidia bacterium]